MKRKKNKKKKSRKNQSKHEQMLVLRNFVAKNSQRSGSGAHKDKTGEHANRSRQKQQWRKEENL